MILDKKTAKELETLVHPDVQEALLILFASIEREESSILRNPDAKLEDLKLFQGKMILLHELKQYKNRILDAIQNI